MYYALAHARKLHSSGLESLSELLHVIDASGYCDSYDVCTVLFVIIQEEKVHWMERKEA